MVEKAGRTFTDTAAARERVPLLLGLVGPSGSGKTYSALRLASGIVKETGGEIFCIDTEARRALHYADTFKFRHVEFKAPFSPLDYLSAVQFCASRGAKVIIVDSMSHEHEGPGGVLEMHDAELDRLAGNDFGKRERVKMLAWVKPKQERRKLIGALLQMNLNFIFCFRAKEKLKIVRGQEPVPLGWQPIAGEEFIYEMTMSLLLPPNSGGIPELAPTEIGERMMVKVPQQFRPLMQARPLDETLGAALAKWAAGNGVAGPDPDKAALLKAVQDDIGTLAPGATADAKAARLGLMESAFGVKSWREIQGLPLELLARGATELTKRRGSAATELEDDIPFGEPPTNEAPEREPGEEPEEYLDPGEVAALCRQATGLTVGETYEAWLRETYGEQFMVPVGHRAAAERKMHDLAAAAKKGKR